MFLKMNFEIYRMWVCSFCGFVCIIYGLLCSFYGYTPIETIAKHNVFKDGNILIL